MDKQNRNDIGNIQGKHRNKKIVAIYELIFFFVAIICCVGIYQYVIEFKYETLFLAIACLFGFGILSGNIIYYTGFKNGHLYEHDPQYSKARMMLALLMLFPILFIYVLIILGIPRLSIIGFFFFEIFLLIVYNYFLIKTTIKKNMEQLN